jgi:ethanolamine ammonia-lyase large subunit
MPKTIEDYMNDPEIANEPSALREIHAIRLKIYDEIKNMTVEERTAYFSGSAARLLGKDSAARLLASEVAASQ